MREPFKAIGYAFLLSGILALLLSTVYENVASAFIGLGVTFWGALLLYTRSEEYVKGDLLTYTTLSTLADIDKILSELGYQGKGIYLPPRYFRDFETSKVFISKEAEANLPSAEEIQQEEHKIFLRDLGAAIVTPPGLLIAKLFEKKLGKSFTEVDPKYLGQKVLKLFVKDLEVAEDLEIRTTGETIHVKVTNSIYKNIYKEKGKLSITFDVLGDPLCSAIACALTKSTGKPVVIERIQASKDGKIVEANFRLLEKNRI